MALYSINFTVYRILIRNQKVLLIRTNENVCHQNDPIASRYVNNIIINDDDEFEIRAVRRVNYNVFQLLFLINDLIKDLDGINLSKGVSTGLDDS